jgi:hypothetical protein
MQTMKLKEALINSTHEMKQPGSIDTTDEEASTAQRSTSLVQSINQRLLSLILVLSIALISPVIASAQPQNSTPSNKEVIDRISKELGLDDTQKSRVEAILNDERKKVEAVFNEERKKLQQIQEQTHASLQAVLTPEQMDKLDKKMREQSDKNNAARKK